MTAQILEMENFLGSPENRVESAVYELEGKLRELLLYLRNYPDLMINQKDDLMHCRQLLREMTIQVNLESLIRRGR